MRRALRNTPGGITVSTLKEAEYFLAHGIRDIIYAVGVAPAKFAHVFSLLRNGAQLNVITDNLDAVRQLAGAASSANVRVPVLIELDVDDHRSGVAPGSQLLLDLGQALTSTSGVTLAGVLTHAGDSTAAVAPRRSFALPNANVPVRSALHSACVPQAMMCPSYPSVRRRRGRSRAI